MNLLGAILYDPSSAGSQVTTSLLAMTALNTTNLRIAFTVPPSGFVKVKQSIVHHGSTTIAQVLLGILEGATVRARVACSANLLGTAIATSQVRLEADYVVAGLTPGAAVNWDFAAGVEIVASANGALKWGGPNNTTTNDAFGAVVFEIWDPRPLPTAAPGAANGVQICGANAATTYATLTSTGAFTVNGVSAVSQTGDNFARLGAPTGASVSADIAAVKAQTAAIETDTQDIQARLPAALVSGRIDASVGAMAANVLTAAAIASDAITDAKVASDVTIASVTGAVGSVTGLTASDVGAIKAKTDNLPTDPADQSLIIAATDAVMSRLGAPAGASMSADIAAVKSDSAAILVDTGTTLDGKLDTIDGIVDAILVDTGTTLDGKLDTIDANVDAILVDTAEIGAAGAGLSAVPWNAAWDAEVQSEAADALAAYDPPTKAELDSAVAPLALEATLATASAFIDTEVAAIKAKTDNLPASPAAVGSAMTLTSGERTAVANEVEAQIIDDTDAEKVLTAITDKIASVNPSLEDLTLAAIASQVRTELTTELALIDVAISTRGTGVALTAPNVRTAVGLASANLDTQLDNLPTNAELATALGTADDATLAQVALVKARTDLIPAAPAAVADIPTANQNADALLARNVAGGSSTGRKVAEALAFLRNRWTLADGTLTIYDTDDTTVLWTATVATNPDAVPVTGTIPV